MGPRLEAKRILTFVPYSRSYSNFSKVPRCTVGYSGDSKFPQKSTADIVNAH
jgi:hypothetical protein